MSERTYSAGLVTAYGAAVRGGYRGTYAEFCRQQAEYADNAAAVEQAKTDVQSAATSAAGSATSAGASATAAAGSATSAGASATAAAGSATTAGQHKDAAATSATNAASSATEAAASATSAASSASAAQAVLESIPEEYSDLSEDVDKLKADLGALDAKIDAKSGLSDDVKTAILNCFKNIAFNDNENDSSYYDALEEALYPPKTVSSITVSYTQSSTVYSGSSLDTLKSDLIVTAHYSDSTSAVVSNYTLSGTLSTGTSTITVSYNGKTATFTVTVTDMPTLSSISATYTPSVVYVGDSLDSIKDSLTVKAIYSDSSEVELSDSDYALSGTLTGGSNTITVSYSGKTTTVTVGVHDFVFVKGYTMGVSSTPIRMKTSADRTVIADVYGSDYPIKMNDGSASSYFAFPIREGATTITLTGFPRTGVNTVLCVYEWTNNELVRVNSAQWSMAKSYDISDYNDGTYIMTIGIDTGTADMSGWSVSIQ